ncbi:MAG: phosphotransferase [Micrococcales bacterium]|nr:phosphotransferase [Micrococcales bacterium]
MVTPPATWGGGEYLRLGPGEERPAIVDALADGSVPRLAWRNELGGQTWRIGDRYVKWSPRRLGTDLLAEAERMRWLEGRHPAPRLLETGEERTGEDETAQGNLSAASPGESAVAERWRARPERAVRVIAGGLRRLHALPVDAVPAGWTSWLTREPAALGPRPPIERPVLAHGDACSPNTLIAPDGSFAAHVDVGDLAVGDRWADLAVATMAIGWNYGAGWDGAFYDAYGIQPDAERIRWYRALWHAEA